MIEAKTREKVREAKRDKVRGENKIREGRDESQRREESDRQVRGKKED